MFRLDEYLFYIFISNWVWVHSVSNIEISANMVDSLLDIVLFNIIVQTGHHIKDLLKVTATVDIVSHKFLL